jgi:hypothetical protein
MQKCLIDASWFMKHRGDVSKAAMVGYDAADVMGAETITATVPEMT